MSNPLYAGRIAHKGTTYPGAHTAIIDAQTWQAVQAQLANNALQHRTRTNAKAPSLLAGLLVDAAGQRFTPSHAVKAGRRYRYYIDSALIGHQQPATNPLRRIPAREIEGVVINGLADLLGSPRRLAEILGDDQIDAGQMQRLIDNARRMQTKLRAATPASSAALLKPLLHQVVLDTAQVQLHLSRTQLRVALQLAANAATSDENDIGVLSIPARIRTRGAQLKIVMENTTGPVPQPPDPALLKALGRAFDWLHRLQSGQAASVTAIATAEQLTGSYVTRVLRLAFLAPDIVAAIMRGTQPVELTIERILRHGRLPLSWHAQRHQLGFPPT